MRAMSTPWTVSGTPEVAAVAGRTGELLQEEGVPLAAAEDGTLQGRLRRSRTDDGAHDGPALRGAEGPENDLGGPGEIVPGRPVSRTVGGTCS